MKKYNITEALTADIHFQQAGFKALFKRRILTIIYRKIDNLDLFW